MKLVYLLIIKAKIENLKFKNLNRILILLLKISQ